MATLLKRGWWVLLLRGLVAALFGVLAYIWPQLTVATLVLLFGAYALVDGVFAVVGSLVHRYDDWWLMLLVGLADIVAGVLTFLQPSITALVLIFLIAARALVTGALDIVAGIRLRKEIEGEWLLILGGIASVLFGLIAFARPGAGALVVIWLIATYAIILGVLQVILAFKVRSWGEKLEQFKERIGN